MNIKLFTQKLTKLGVAMLSAGVFLRLAFSFATWVRFFQSINFAGESLAHIFSAASWQLTHSNILLNTLHSVWLWNHVAFASAMHFATVFMSIAAIVLFAALILDLAIWVFAQPATQA